MFYAYKSHTLMQKHAQLALLHRETIYDRHLKIENWLAFMLHDMKEYKNIQSNVYGPELFNTLQHNFL